MRIPGIVIDGETSVSVLVVTPKSGQECHNITTLCWRVMVPTWMAWKSLDVDIVRQVSVLEACSRLLVSYKYLLYTVVHKGRWL